MRPRRGSLISRRCTALASRGRDETHQVQTRSGWIDRERPLDSAGGGAWPFSVGRLIRVANAVNEGDPSRRSGSAVQDCVPRGQTEACERDCRRVAHGGATRKPCLRRPQTLRAARALRGRTQRVHNRSAEPHPGIPANRFRSGNGNEAESIPHEFDGPSSMNQHISRFGVHSEARDLRRPE